MAEDGRPASAAGESRATPSPAIVMLLLVIVGVTTILAGQILLQGYPTAPRSSSTVATLGGLLLLAVAFSEALFRRLPETIARQAAPVRRALDSHVSPIPLYLAGLVAAVAAALVAGDEKLIRLPSLAIGLWVFAIVAVLLAASALGRPRGGLGRWELVGLVALVLAAAVLRLARLDEIPWLLAGDEASVGMSAREFLDGVWNNPFGVAWYSFPSLFFLLPAASIGVLGQTIEALRLPAAIAGTLTVLALFLFARAAFGRTLAFLSAGYLAFFHFHIHFSRIGLNNIWDALVLTLFSYLLWRAWSEERPALFAWAGIVGGLGQYFYTSTRILLLLVPLWMALAAWRDRGKFRRIGARWLILGAAAAIVAMPLAYFFARHPAEFNAPMARVSLLGPRLMNEVAATGLPAWRILLDRIGLSAMAFTAANLRHWYTIDHPMLLPLPATLFLVGLGIAVLRARDLRFSWVLLWIASAVVAGGLSESTPAAQRYIFAAPAVALLVALPVAEAAARLPRATARGRVLLAAGAAAIIVVAALLDMRFYFYDYTPSRRFSDTNTEVAQNLGQFLLAQGFGQGVEVYFDGRPRMGWNSIETLPYLVRRGTFTDVSEPLAAAPTWPIHRPAVFVFLPENLGDIPWVEHAYPGGEAIVRTGVRGDDLYTIYLLQ